MWPFFQFEIHKRRSYLLLKWPEKISFEIATEHVGRAIKGVGLKVLD